MSPDTTPASLTETDIAMLVDRFYEKVRRDPMLGAVFNPAVDDWDEHKQLLTSFWSSVVLGTRSYRGNPMAAHRPHDIRSEHFEHWLAMWRETAVEVLGGDRAAVFIEAATRIGYSLRYGLGLDERHGSRPLGLPVAGSDR